MSSGVRDERHKRTGEWISEQNQFGNIKTGNKEYVDWNEIKRKEFERRRRQGWRQIIIKPGVDTTKQLRYGIDYEYVNDGNNWGESGATGSATDSKSTAAYLSSSSESSYVTANHTFSESSLPSESTNESPSSPAIASSPASYETAPPPAEDGICFPAIYDGIPCRLRPSGRYV